MGRPIINVPKDRMHAATCRALVERLAPYGRLLEVGIGRRADVAGALARRPGVTVTAIDVVERATPSGVIFRQADISALDPTDPDLAEIDAVYGLNLPPELHRPTLEFATGAGAACAFTTLGGDPPTVPAEPETLPGETLFWARGDA